MTAIEAESAAAPLWEVPTHSPAGRTIGLARRSRVTPDAGGTIHIRTTHSPRRAGAGLPRARRLAPCGVVDPGRNALGADPTTRGAAMNGRPGQLARTPGRPPGNGTPGAPGRPRTYLRESDLDTRTSGTPGMSLRSQGGDQPRREGGRHPRGALRRLDGLDLGRTARQQEDMEVAHRPFRTLDESRLVAAWRTASLFSNYNEPPWVGRKRGSAGRRTGL